MNAPQSITKTRNKKAQSELLSMMLITGILIAIIGSSYMWGIPLIEKGKTSSENEKAESLMKMIKEKIDDVAQTGEQKTFSFDLTGDMELTDDNSLTYSITTRGLTIASTAWVPLAGGSLPVHEYMAATKADGGSDKVNINDEVTCQMTSICPAAQISLTGCEGPYTPPSSLSEGETFQLGSDTYEVDHIDCAGTKDDLALIIGPEKEKAVIIGVDEAGVLIARSTSSADTFKTIYRLVYRELDAVSGPKNDGYRIKLVRDGNNIINSGPHKITIRRDENARVVGKSKYGGDLTETKIYITMS